MNRTLVSTISGGCRRVLLAISFAVVSCFAAQSWAAIQTDFTIFAARNVVIGGGSEVTGLVGAGTGAAGVGDSTLAGAAGIFGDLRSGDDVTLNNSSFVTGTVTNPDQYSKAATATVGNHVVAMPDLPTLSAATAFVAGVTPQSVGNGQTMNLAPGAWSDISLGGAATLNLLAGEYRLNSLSAGNGLTLNINLSGGDITIYVTDAFSVGGIQTMTLTGGTADNVYVETHASGLNAFRVGGGSGTNWLGTVFTPNGDIHLGSGSSQGTIVGYFWAGRDVDIEHGLDIYSPPPHTPEPISLLVWSLLIGLAGLRRIRE